MTRTAIGAVSLAALGLALAVGAYAMWLVSTLLGIAYLVWLAISAVALVYAFCSKCPAQDACAHIAPAKLARLLPKRVPGPYSVLDLATAIVIVATWLLVPQYWLARSPVLLGVFWLIAIGSGVAIQRRVCPGCTNACCPLMPKRARV